MSIIDTLVYDRTQSDVDYAVAQTQKILSIGIMNLPADERSAYLRGLKGAYCVADTTRVASAAHDIGNRMIALPDELTAYRDSKNVADAPVYHVPYDPSSIVLKGQTAFGNASNFYDTIADAYLHDLRILRQQLPLPTNSPQVPDTMDHMTFATANDIEYLLFVIDTVFKQTEADLYSKIDRTVDSFEYANLFYCGE